MDIECRVGGVVEVGDDGVVVESTVQLLKDC